MAKKRVQTVVSYWNGDTGALLYYINPWTGEKQDKMPAKKPGVEYDLMRNETYNDEVSDGQ